MSARQASPAVIAEVLALVGVAEAAFRSRWRMTTLLRVDAELHGLLLEQIDLYSEEIIAGSESELRLQAAAMVRGWSAACRAMEGHADDAYLIGKHWPTKTIVVVTDHKQSLERAKDLLTEQDRQCRVIAMAPDEIAKMVGQMEIVANAKAVFPDAEVIDINLHRKDAA